ncbi:MAG: hypothetical protein AAF447_04880 [Myxococcota bacterium]
MTRAPLLFATLALAAPSPAAAFSIASGFSEPCHEVLSAQAFDDVALTLPTARIVVPRGSGWRRVGRFVLETVGVDPTGLTEVEFFVLTSLLVGVRSPDTEGHAILNLESARTIHTNPNAEEQYAHALRGLDDDGVAGDEAAVAGTRARILEEVAEADAAIRRPPEEQLLRTQLYFDFYGLVDLDVWAVAFHLGRAAHALQDSFAHTIRDEHDDFRRVLTVFNFVEAVSGTLRESRDGLAHSDAMDQCSEETADTRAAARRATGELFVAAREVFLGRDADAVESVLDAWLRYRPGCSVADEFCDNGRWLRLARQDPSEPFLCSAAGVPAGWIASQLAPLGVVLLLVRRRRRSQT